MSGKTKKVLVVSLGSADKGWIPSDKMFASFAKEIKKIKGGGVLITHPFVSFREIEIPSGGVFVANGAGPTKKSIKKSAKKSTKKRGK